MRLPKFKPVELPEVYALAHEGTEPMCPCGHPPLVCARFGLSALPLGAIVATCRLVDVVPIIRNGDRAPEHGDWIVVGDSGLWLRANAEDWQPSNPRPNRNLADQLPWGDYRPGRWAWLLADVEPTTERCPRCWGSGDHEQIDPITDERIDPDLRLPCTRCDGEGSCDPVPARGRQGLWEWTP